MKKILAALFALVLSALPAAAQTFPSGPYGSLNYWGPSGSPLVLLPGLSGQCLQSGGTGEPVAWGTCYQFPSVATNTFLGNVSGGNAQPTWLDVNAILNTIGYDIARPPQPYSIIYKSFTAPNNNWQTLPPGTRGQVLTSFGLAGPPAWQAPGSASLGTICQTVGAILYFDPSLNWLCLSPGAAGQLLQTNGGAAAPTWVNQSGVNVNVSSLVGSTQGAFQIGSGGTGLQQVQISGLVVGQGGSNPTAYAGGSCTNQVVTAISANGTLTCTSLTSAFMPATVAFSTSVTTPTVIGGTAANSVLTLESTSGVGTSDAIVFNTGSQRQAMQISTDGSVGIGSVGAAAGGGLDINTTGVAVGLNGQPAGQVRLIRDGVQPGYYLYQFIDGGSAGPIFRSMVANGSVSSPTAVPANTQIFNLSAGVYNGTTYTSPSARFSMFTLNTQTSSDASSYMTFSTVPSGSSVIAEAMRINGSGGVGIGTTSDPGVGNLNLGGASTGGVLNIGGTTPQVNFFPNGATSNAVIYESSNTLNLSYNGAGTSALTLAFTSNNAHFGSTTAATSPTAASVTLAGGLGVSGAVYTTGSGFIGTTTGLSTLNLAGPISTPAQAIKTSSYSEVAADNDIIFNCAASCTLTLLSAATYPGQEIWVKTYAAFTVVSASSNVIPITGGSAGTAILAATAGKWARLKSNGTNWEIMAAN